MDGFQLIWILLVFITFATAYFLKRRTSRFIRTSEEEVNHYKEKVKRLEDDLRSSKQKNLEYQKEIKALKASSKLLGVTQKDGLEENRSESQSFNQPNEEIAIAALRSQNRPDQEQKEKSSKRASKFDALKNNNLQIVEGIGPKMESVLKENGVQSWSQLGHQTEKSLRDILEKYGNKYKIIDPVSWPEQAQLAANSNWSQLIRMQKGLDIGRDSSLGDTPAKIEKIMVKLGILKMYKQDDLKAIEGIGPKIAELLNAEGINLWQQLAQTSEQALQKILDQAGKRFQLADPSSWPKQAALADEGRFDELSDYQDILQGGV